MELQFDHVAIAVPSITAALPLFELLTGSRGSPPETVAAQKVAVTFIGTDTGRLEIIEPTGPDSTVQRFLERRGSGLHHLAFRVRDLQAALDRLEAAGIRLIDREPRPGARGHRVAFLHPASTSGVLIELVEAEPDGQ